MDRIVFFADVLGFSGLARRPGAVGAVDALSDLVNGTMIGELCGAVTGLLLEYGLDPRIGAHYRAYFSLAWRSLLRLEEQAPDEFRRAVQVAALGERKDAITSVIGESDLEIPASEWKTVLG